MARIARVIAEGHPHRVTQRGNRRQRTFFSDADEGYSGDSIPISPLAWAAGLAWSFGDTPRVPGAPDRALRLMREGIATAGSGQDELTCVSPMTGGCRAWAKGGPVPIPRRCRGLVIEACLAKRVGGCGPDGMLSQQRESIAPAIRNPKSPIRNPLPPASGLQPPASSLPSTL